MPTRKQLGKIRETELEYPQIRREDDARYKADLLSSQFSDCLQKMFDELGKTVFDKRIVQKFTKSYYVMVDLKGGIPLNEISQDRLYVFHSVLSGYMLHNCEDELSKKLWQMCDDALS